MIKITVNPHQNAKTFSFDKKIVIIGEGSPDTVDICFPLEGLHQNHLRIIQKEHDFWVINQANDPFVTHNGHPFGKKNLQVGDLIQIRDHILKIEVLQDLSTPSISPPPSPSSSIQEPYNPFPDIEDLANDENPEGWYPSYVQPPETIAPSSVESNGPSLLEEAYNVDDQKRTPTSQSSSLILSNTSWRKRALKILALSICLSLIIVGLVIVELYFRASGKSEKEEILAAESLADYAMSLTYATVYHIAPQQQNWIDPLFIKNNLLDLLSTTSIPCGNIDGEGVFCNSPYILRFYTNRDFSRFLLLAQPAPTVSQWLIPKDTLLIESESMDIRKVEDLKTLNRLLSNPNPLDDSNGKEVLEIIRESKVITLSYLAEITGKKEFAPPKALHFLKPGAENRIYNAPRYHQFTSNFLKKVLFIVNDSLNSHEILILQNELETLSKFRDLILYSPGGLHQAVNSYKALNKLSPPHPFFTAYLLSSEKGDILSSHLILDKEFEKLIKTEGAEIAAETHLPPLFAKTLEKEELLSSLLHKKAQQAQKELQPILVNLYTSLSDSLEKDSIHLPTFFFEWISQYQEIERRFQSEIEEVLREFRIQYPSINDLLIERMLREYGILDLYQSSASNESEQTTDLKKQWDAYQSLLTFPMGNHRRL